MELPILHTHADDPDEFMFDEWIDVELAAVAEPVDSGEHRSCGRIALRLAILPDDADLANRLPDLERAAREQAADYARRERIAGPYTIRARIGRMRAQSAEAALARGLEHRARMSRTCGATDGEGA